MTKEVRNKKTNKMKRVVDNAGKVAFGFCAGAVVVGVVSVLKMNKHNTILNKYEEALDVLAEETDSLTKGIDIISRDNGLLQHEIDIRDCMVMEGIDGDPEIYARRMQHFRDYKIDTVDIDQSKEESKNYCIDAALEAEATYQMYIKSMSKFTSEVPVITEDDELPF